MAICINGIKVESFNFSGGECHVKIIPSDITEHTNIIAHLDSSDAIMQLLMVVDAVRRVKPHTKIDLTIPYFPYARQDRVCNEGEAFSVHVMAGLINQLQCHSITIYDPHSQVTVDALDNCKVISLADIILNSELADKIQHEGLRIVSPDKGAQDKVYELGAALAMEHICASKVRDSLTGNIIATEIHDDVVGKDCVILDDICDGGRTFIELAKVLKAKGAGRLYLYVTHGIFSEGLNVLKEHFTHVYCFHTMIAEEKIDRKFLTCLKKI